jgi:hypothetical protein
MPNHYKEPLKLIDIKSMLSGLGQRGVDGSLALSGILPGQGGIPAASPEFLAQNPHLVGQGGLPQGKLESLAGMLGMIGKDTQQAGNQAILDRQDRGFFANTLDKRLRGAGL